MHDEEEDEDVEYAIVGSSEADVLQNKISNESPVGRSLIGAHKGETVTAFFIGRNKGTAKLPRLLTMPAA